MLTQLEQRMADAGVAFTEQMPELSKSAKQWATWIVSHQADALCPSINHAICDYLHPLYSAPSGDQGFLILLKEWIENNNVTKFAHTPEELEDEDRAWQKVIDTFLDFVQEKINDVAPEKGRRWTDVSRAFLAPLRYLYTLSMDRELYAEVMIAPTSSIVDQYIDPYTGEPDPLLEEDYQNSVLFSRKFQMSQTQEAEEIEVSDETEGDEFDNAPVQVVPDTVSNETLEDGSQDFLDISAVATTGVLDIEYTSDEGFDAGYEPPTSAIEEFNAESGDIRTPTWMEIQEDEAASEDYHDRWINFKPSLSAAKKFINKQIWELDRAAAQLGMEPNWHNEIERIKAKFHADPSYNDLLNGIKLNAARMEDAKRMFLASQNAFMLQLSDAKSIWIGGRRLYDYIVLTEGDDEELATGFSSFEEYKKEMYFYSDESASDFNPHGTDPDREMLEEWIEGQIAEIKAKADATNQTNPVRTGAFVEGFLRQMMNARSITKMVNGKWTNTAIAAGWDAWRESISKEGARAYRAAEQAGMDRKACNDAFKQALRKQKSQLSITGLKTNGLILSSGRFVDWRIAAIKLKADEIKKDEAFDRVIKALGKSKPQGSEQFLKAVVQSEKPTGQR